MLNFFGSNGAKVLFHGNESVLFEDFVWLDCFQPTPEEERLIETTLGIELPTREEMMEIETTNRLVEEGAVYTMTTTLVSKSDTNAPENAPVTFILTPHHLITVRYSEFVSFRTFIADFQHSPASYPTADRTFTALQSMILARLADVLERVGFEIEHISNDLFKNEMAIHTHVPFGSSSKNPFHGQGACKNGKRRRPINTRALLEREGSVGNLDAKVRESLVSLQRTVSFLNDARTARFSPESRVELAAARTDIQALSEHSYFLADKITFLLDATLGVINIEQNDIIRIFSIAAVMFMPPTLVASVYGMNFKHMPELSWQWGYEYGVLIILLSALVPFLFFKKKGWL